MPMSIAETYEIYYIVLATMDQIFQFWITASFAVIVTSYFASEMLTKWLYWLVSIAYALFAVFLGTRYVIAANKLTELREVLIEAGEYFSRDGSNLIGVLTVSLFVLGTIGTLTFLWHSRRRHLT